MRLDIRFGGHDEKGSGTDVGPHSPEAKIFGRKVRKGAITLTGDASCWRAPSVFDRAGGTGQQPLITMLRWPVENTRTLARSWDNAQTLRRNSAAPGR